jgi:hypothetical protein
VSPAAQLFPIHPKLAANNLADFLIDAAQFEFPDWKAHRSAAIAAPS